MAQMPKKGYQKHQLPEAAIEMYLNGQGLEELGGLFGIPTTTLRRMIVGKGLPLRGSMKTVVHRQRIAESRRIDLHIQWGQFEGMSCEEIGQQLGVSAETVRRRAVAEGVDRLPASARPEKNAFWNGGRAQDKHGYLLVKVWNHPSKTAAGYVREHRLVMEAFLGRLLQPEEVVDHIDGVLDHNQIENLQLFPTNAAHLRATLKGRAKQSRRRTQFLEAEYIPSSSETGALPWLELHPLFPFRAETEGQHP